MNRHQMEMLADAIIESVAKPMDSFHGRIKLLEDADDIAVVDPIDFERQYPDGTLGAWKNGLWIFRLKTGSWTCIVRSLWEVRITNEAGGATKFEFELSDGEVMTSITGKPKTKSAAKPVKLLKKPTKQVKLLPREPTA